MTTKDLGSTILYTALTVGYYIWMISAWIHLDESKVENHNAVSNKTEEDFSIPDYKVREGDKSKPFPSLEFVDDDEPFVGESNKSKTVVNTYRSADLKGEPPPSHAFWIKEPIYRCDSILKINTSPGASYVVKVVDPHNGEVIMMCYLPAGISQEIDVPSGTFEIRYTSGTEWFGNYEMFGDKGSYARADKLFTFDEGSGYELTLYSVRNGNLHTSKMKKEDF